MRPLLEEKESCPAADNERAAATGCCVQEVVVERTGTDWKRRAICVDAWRNLDAARARRPDDDRVPVQVNRASSPDVDGFYLHIGNQNDPGVVRDFKRGL